MNAGGLSTRRAGILAAAVVVLAGVSTVGIAAASGAFRGGYRSPSGVCAAPTSLPGSVVNVTLTNMGRGMMTGGMMRIFIDRPRVPEGQVSFRVVNTGSLVHELVVLPLPSGQHVGDRQVGPGNNVDETGSLGEASKSCGSGAGDGIDPGAIGWVTLDLPAGDYELICNLPGHYAAGMYAELTVG